MTTQTHTPGRWYYRHTITQDGRGGFVRHDVYAGDTRIAEVGGGIHAPDNARLIAAAPDLLEALQACQPLINDLWRHYGESQECANVQAQLRAAISKAQEGEV